MKSKNLKVSSASNLPVELKFGKTSVDRIIKHYVDGKQLPPQLDEMRLKYEFANALMGNGYQRRIVQKMIQEKYGIQQSQAYRIVHNAIQLFGDINKTSDEGKRHIASENYLRLSKIAEQAKDFQTAKRCWDSYCRINNLNTEKISIDWTGIQIPDFVFTSDPKALKESESELAEFEELK